MEDIVDTGKTIGSIIRILETRDPASVKVCTFLSKPDVHRGSARIDYFGFEVGNDFVVGYGLDLNGAYRELPYVATLRDEVMS